eukprot:GEMP01092122.1.p1 GENE.GEMP01092122.1~~GEMP01092122.1.p1  ORF type:complete len:208 (+),score=53.39 GEMP01092122.1:179-802(+)
MLPLNRRIGRDWMMVGVASIWATVITIMFLSKMKTSQDIIAALFFLLIFFLANLDNLFARYQSYKVFRVLKPALIAEAKWAAVCVAVAVGLELSPLAWSPGWIYPCCAFTIHFLLGRHCHPMLILGSWAGARNLLTKKQASYYIGAQLCGGALSALALAFAWAVYHDLQIRDGLPSMLSFIEMVAANGLCFGAAFAKSRLYEKEKTS